MKVTFLKSAALTTLLAASLSFAHANGVPPVTTSSQAGSGGCAAGSALVDGQCVVTSTVAPVAQAQSQAQQDSVSTDGADPVAPTATSNEEEIATLVVDVVTRQVEAVVAAQEQTQPVPENKASESSTESAQNNQQPGESLSTETQPVVPEVPVTETPPDTKDATVVNPQEPPKEALTSEVEDNQQISENGQSAKVQESEVKSNTDATANPDLQTPVKEDKVPEPNSNVESASTVQSDSSTTPAETSDVNSKTPSSPQNGHDEPKEQNDQAASSTATDQQVPGSGSNNSDGVTETGSKSSESSTDKGTVSEAGEAGQAGKSPEASGEASTAPQAQDPVSGTLETEKQKSDSDPQPTAEKEPEKAALQAEHTETSTVSEDSSNKQNSQTTPKVMRFTSDGDLNVVPAEEAERTE